MLTQEERREIYSLLTDYSIDEDGEYLLEYIKALIDKRPAILNDPLLCAYAARQLSPLFPWDDSIDLINVIPLVKSTLEMSATLYERSAALRYDSEILKNLSVFYSIRPDFADFPKRLRSLCFLLPPPSAFMERRHEYFIDREIDLYKFCKSFTTDLDNILEEKRNFYYLLLSTISPPGLDFGGGIGYIYNGDSAKLNKLVSEFLELDPRARWEMLSERFPP